MYTVPPTKAAEPDSRFQYDLDGNEVSAPLLELVDTDTAAVFNAAVTDVDFRLAYCRALSGGDSEVEAKLRALEADRLGPLIEAYDKASGISAGESDASTRS